MQGCTGVITMERREFKLQFSEKATPHLRTLVRAGLFDSSGATPEWRDAHQTVFSLTTTVCNGNAGEWALAELGEYLAGDEVRDTVLRVARTLQPSPLQAEMRWLQVFYRRLCRFSTTLTHTFAHPIGLCGSTRTQTWLAMVVEPLWVHLRVAIDTYLSILNARVSRQWNDFQLCHFLLDPWHSAERPMFPGSVVPISRLQEQEVPLWWYGCPAVPTSDNDVDECSWLNVKLRREVIRVIQVFRVPSDPSIRTSDRVTHFALLP